MSKRRTEPEAIRNPENYFNRFIALEVERDKEQQKAYYEMFDSLEEMLAGGSEGVSGESLMCFATNLHGDEFERCIEGTYSLDWIEMIENPRLYAAVKSLSHKDKWLLTLRYKYCLTQRDIAPLFNMSQAAICQRESSIKKLIQKFFENAYQKP